VALGFDHFIGFFTLRKHRRNDITFPSCLQERRMP
jgi:hypothetical protein